MQRIDARWRALTRSLRLRVPDAVARRPPGRTLPTRGAVYRAMAAFVFMALFPGRGWACACGCGVFDVGTAAMFPSESGGRVFTMYNFADQYSNWHDASKAPVGDNSDKVIRTHYFTLGLQYMINRAWGFVAQLPFAERYVKEAENDGAIARHTHGALGDVRLEGLYTGLADDMSTGLSLGVKLASGDFTYPHFERENQIGTGSTDALLGAYHIGRLPLTYAGRPFSWYAQVHWQAAMWTQQQYHPGNELNVAAGAVYDFGAVGFVEEIAPVLGFIGTDRLRDHGANADPENTGYDRLLIAPGLEVAVDAVRVYGDVEFPLYQDVNGNQVVAPVLVKLVASYEF